MAALYILGQVTGSEDCLYLDISVPGGVSANNKKSVMVWIHGGGYISGNKDIYPGVALAALGDVIVVGINYRLGALGFLSEGKGGDIFQIHIAVVTKIILNVPLKT